MSRKFDVSQYGYGLVGKEMEGEVRIRFSDLRKTIATLTQATESGWQQPHYHKGLTEHYVVFLGTIACARGNTLQDFTVQFYSPGETFSVPPSIDHNIWRSAGARFLTSQTGTPIGNPEKNSRDWFEASELFSQILTQFEKRALLLADRDGFLSQLTSGRKTSDNN